jgi:hypothetical protein
LAISSKIKFNPFILFHFIRQRRIDEEPLLFKAKEQISSMINELRDFKKEQAALTNELEQLKFKKSEYSDKLVKNKVNFYWFYFNFSIESNKFLVIKC